MLLIGPQISMDINTHLKKFKVANTKSSIRWLTLNHNEGNDPNLTVAENNKNNSNKKAKMHCLVLLLLFYNLSSILFFLCYIEI